MDVEDWILDSLQLNATKRSRFAEKYTAYCSDCQALGVVALGRRQFSKKVREKLEPHRARNSVQFLNLSGLVIAGVALNSEAQPEAFESLRQREQSFC